MTRWAREQVLALAPDASSVMASRKLAAGSGWSQEGCLTHVVWGLCQGSDATTHRTAIDLSGPAYSCSCPSRKFPCKHVLALLLRWSEAKVPEASEPPEYAAAWLASRAERTERARAKAAAVVARTAEPEKATARAQARERAVRAGLAELDRWLADQIRTGLAALPAKGYAAFEPMAARMIDTQAPGIAARLRDLPNVIASGSTWPQRLLEELALLRLLVRAHRQLADLDSSAPELAATVRQHVGYPVAKELVLGRPAVTDLWSIWGRRDSESGNLRQRTVWLQGARSRRMAVSLSFAGPGQPLDSELVPGTAFEGALHFYPGSRPNRVLVGEHGPPGRPGYPESGLVDAALDQVAATLGADPWARDTAVWLRAVPVRAGAGWVVADELGDTLPLQATDAQVWRLVAVCGGQASPILVDWSPIGWLPVSVATPDGLVAL